ncbi:3-isopropylmalate dehydrogenase, partial [Rickettsiella grylli]
MDSVNSKPFSSAKNELKKRRDHQKVAWPAYELAFLDHDFLLHKSLRSVRLQLELLKPELSQQKLKIESTIVVFGSARVIDPEITKQQLKKIQHTLKQNPTNLSAKKEEKRLKNQLEKGKYYQESQRFSQIISERCQKNKRRHFVIVTGGGPGIMEAANRGAQDVNAKSIGLNIVLPHEQSPNPYISPDLCFQFHYFAIRKMHFLIRARALVCFPGGYGTLDELFEALTLLQTKKIKPIPLLLFGKKYWSKLINFNFLVSEGMI